MHYTFFLCPTLYTIMSLKTSVTITCTVVIKKSSGFQAVLKPYNASTVAVFNPFFRDTATVPFTRNSAVVSKIAVLWPYNG